MTNGKCTTWFVVKWLGEHTKHTAKAPKVELMREMRADVDPFLGVRIRQLAETWFCSTTVPSRSDWTIYNESGEPVKFKRKRKARAVGILHSGERLVVVDELDTPFRLHRCVSMHGYDVLIRERKS